MPYHPGSEDPGTCPWAGIPTPTDLPPDTASGTRIEYTVQAGDTLASIASKFNTTLEDILALNDDVIEDENNIPVGITLVIRVNLVTPTPTFAPTSTLAS